MQYVDPVQADVIVANFYLPDTPEIKSSWVGIVALEGRGGRWLTTSNDTLPLGKWTQIVLDLRGKYDSNDNSLTGRPLFIQAVFSIEARSKLQSDTILVRLDDLYFPRTLNSQ